MTAIATATTSGLGTVVSAGDEISVINPATGGEVGRVLALGADEVDRRVRAAEAAFTGWRGTPAIQRAEVLLKFARAVRERTDEVIRILVTEGGQPARESEWEATWVADAFEYYAGMCRSYGGSIAPTNSTNGINLVQKDPIGVVAAIVPWNYPILLWAWKAAPALAGGSVVLTKPSPDTPLSVQLLDDMLTEAGLPANVHQVVNGGAETGAALISHPQVDAIAFTGSLAAGKAVLHTAAEHVKRIATLELSGHDPMIVWDDVDMDIAVEATAFSAFVHAGQVCTSAERIYVASSIVDEFVQRLSAYTESLVVGDPSSYATEIGPQMNAGQLERVERYVDAARAAGATIHTGGRVGTEHGDLFYLPTVITGLSHQQLKELGEVFGPIAPIVPVDTFEEAVRLANDSDLGLGSNVLTSDLGRAMTASRELRFGSVWINNPLLDNNGGPFGGFRQSGYGRELGVEGYEAFLESKHVTLEYSVRRQDFWFHAAPSTGSDQA